MVRLSKVVVVLVSCFTFLLFFSMICLATIRTGSVIPKPVQIRVQDGEFRLTSATLILVDKYSSYEGQQLSEMLSPATGFPLKVGGAGAAGVPVIEIKLDPSLGKLGEEGYHLTVTPKKVTILAPKPAGLFYGFQSLRQLLPPEIFRRNRVAQVEWTIPCVQIEDYPRFSWRGVLLDSVRYFVPKEFVKKFIDLLALHKMNCFYWHLTDDQGWRIEIKKYPKLTEVGAWRNETMIGRLEDDNARNLKFDGKRHGGFYTQSDIREIVEFGRVRHVNVIPDIEMPGHAQAAIAAYPELGNTGKPVEVGTTWGISENIFNVNESTIQFLQDVLTEVLDLFPSRFIGTGGDEVPKTQWEVSPEAQARIKELGLKNEEELQAYFTHRMDQFLTSKGRRMIWDEDTMKGGLAPNALVMPWRGEKAGIAAIRAGHDVVMAPDEFTYFDYYQSKDTASEPLAIGGYLPLEVVYNYEPIPKEIPLELARHVLGAQGNLWTEYIPNPRLLEYMAFPRVSALAEVTWTPRDKKDYAEFRQRLPNHVQRLSILDVNYRPLDAEK
jgi:hexosaminidase